MKDNVTPENLPEVIYRNQRVLTTELLASLYGTETVRIRQNHQQNATRFIAGTHYIRLEGEELGSFKLLCPQVVDKRAKSLMLWTERGAARHAKILDTDEAWETYERLEDGYFKIRAIINDVAALEQRIRYLESETAVEAKYAESEKVSKMATLMHQKDLAHQDMLREKHAEHMAEKKRLKDQIRQLTAKLEASRAEHARKDELLGLYRRLDGAKLLGGAA